LAMSPRKDPETKPHAPSHLGFPPSQDKERHDEEDRHHPMDDHPHPHPGHHLNNQDIRPDHDAHTNIPHDELPPHQNAPSPIKVSKKITKLGLE
jgi:hypothetical protein